MKQSVFQGLSSSREGWGVLVMLVVGGGGGGGWLAEASGEIRWRESRREGGGDSWP